MSTIYFVFTEDKTVGASLLAMAVAQSTSMLNVPALSRASSLTVDLLCSWFLSSLKINGGGLRRLC
ncbi:hypothetical protein PMHK_35720 [Pseudomonas sp. MHK4]